MATAVPTPPASQPLHALWHAPPSPTFLSPPCRPLWRRRVDLPRRRRGRPPCHCLRRPPDAARISLPQPPAQPVLASRSLRRHPRRASLPLLPAEHCAGLPWPIISRLLPPLPRYHKCRPPTPEGPSHGGGARIWPKGNKFGGVRRVAGDAYCTLLPAASYALPPSGHQNRHRPQPFPASIFTCHRHLRAGPI